jgi:beta-mannosidase
MSNNNSGSSKRSISVEQYFQACRMQKERTKFPIASGWEWKLASTNSKRVPADAKLLEWAPASQFPSVIQLELLETGQILNPNIGENERLCQWVGDCDWEYRCRFSTPPEAFQYPTSELVFEGLDTFAIATLNGKKILKSDNMFLPARVDVKNLLRGSDDVENEMVILFESALKKGTELEEQLGVKQSLMRDTRRMHMRKAQVSIFPDLVFALLTNY